MHIAQSAATQRHIQPLHRGFRHQVMDPESTGKRDRHIANIRGDIQMRMATVILQTNTATRLYLQQPAINCQTGGLNGPAGHISPQHDFSIHLEAMHHAEAGWPIKFNRGSAIKAHAQAILIGLQPTTDAPHSRCMSDRIETKAPDTGAGMQHATGMAPDIHIVQYSYRLRGLHPMPQPRRQGIAQCRQLQQWRDIQMCSVHCIALPTCQ